jgi:energy-coupling factor transporter ATP-binding protein EcfA2
MNPINLNPSTPQAAVSGVAQLPEALFGGTEALEDPTGGVSLWNRYHPREIPFFKVALMDQLLKRPYHAVMLEGPFNNKQMAQDYREQTFRSETSINRTGTPSIERLLLCLGNGLFAYLDESGLKVYAPTPLAAEAAAQEFRHYVRPPDERKPHFHVISMMPEGPCAESVPIERSAPVSTEDLALNYGQDFPLWEQQWRERMSKVPSGLTILFGPPGCGKTSFLRALMSRLIETAVFYFVPASEAEMLSNPRFVNFWMRQTARYKGRQKIAILEDADELLLMRDEGSRAKVSNLLNIADGFLGEHLRLHVIATSNEPISKLDPAIVRPGRLLGMREFRRLSREEAIRLAEAKGLVVPEQRDFSLAELYCGGNDTARVDQQQRIGFA